ncbi:adenosylcobinamide-GDP ribazoletransferase [Halobacteriales archaeon Cl-PHB]
MVLTALRGAIGFLTRLPVGHDERAWESLRRAPAALVVGGYLVGTVLAAIVALPMPVLVVGLAYPVFLLVLTGITHADGLADLGDAAVVHGSPAERREVMRDTTIGVGGTVALGLDLVGLALAGVALAGLPLRIGLGLVVAAEVTAKVAMVGLATLGQPTHDGMAAAVEADRGDLVLALVLGLPAAALTWPSPAAGVGIAAGLATAGLVLGWARRTLGGVSGDVYGAGNEMARLAALHLGVVAWTL